MMILNELKKELEEEDRLAINDDTARKETRESTQHSTCAESKGKVKEEPENVDYSIEIEECMQPVQRLPKSTIFRKAQTCTEAKLKSFLNQSSIFYERSCIQECRQNQSFDLGGCKEEEITRIREKDSFCYKSKFYTNLETSGIVEQESAVFMPHSMIQAINRIDSDDFVVQVERSLNSLRARLNFTEGIGLEQYQRIYKISQTYDLPQKIVIELPGAHIVIEDEPLKITVPLAIRGKPGTLLEIRSSIVIDIEARLTSQQPSPLHSFVTQKYSIPNVWFNECSILFNRSVSRQENFKEKNLKCLFTVHKGSNLIVRDCLLRSIFHEKRIKSPDFYIGELYDVCFALKRPEFSSKSTAFSSELSQSEETKRDSELQILSCTLEGFTHFVYGGEDSHIRIEFSSLSNSRCNAIELLNPRQLVFERSLIEKTLGTAISINYQRQEGVSDNKIEREVIIESSKIIGNIGFGVKIKCEKQASKIKKKQGMVMLISEDQSIGTSLSKVRGHSNAFLAYPKIKLIQIRKTRIYHCKKDGVMMQNLLMHPNCGVVKIDKCEIGQNKESNLFLQGIARPYLLSEPQQGSDQEKAAKICVVVKRTKILDASSGFGVYSYNGNFAVQDCEIVGNESGGIMAVGRKDQENAYVRITQSTISNNHDSGIILVDLRGLTEVKRCSLQENKKNGITVEQNFDPSIYKFENNTGDPNYQANITPEENLELVKKTGSVLRVQTCDINGNRQHGLLLKNVQVKLKDVMMVQNLKNAVYMVYASSLCLTVAEKKRSSMRREIHGEIGGKWGKWTPEFEPEWVPAKKSQKRKCVCFPRIGS